MSALATIHFYLMDEIKVNSLRAWFLAARPKTLTGALVPVMMGSALALLNGYFHLWAALICFVFAGLMQIAANFINDLYDFQKGSDRDDRLGPERACAQGWITPSAMKKGIVVTIVVAALAGCSLFFIVGFDWGFVLIGVLSIVFAFLYTMILSYFGMGDVLVILFFGFAAVGGTYYVQALEWTSTTNMVALSSGLVIETLLLINNYRDREADAQSKKMTLVVRFGEGTGSFLYLSTGILAVALLMLDMWGEGHYFAAFLPLLYLKLHYQTWREMVAIHSGKKLNSILGKTSRNMLLFGMLATIGMMIDYLLPYILS